MKIRSITRFAPSRRYRAEDVNEASGFLHAAREAYERAGFEVQTVRLALPPLGTLLEGEETAGALVDLAKRVESDGTAAGIDYLALGPARASDPAAWTQAIPTALHATERVFATVEMVDPNRREIDFGQVRAAAECIVRNSGLRPDGFVNLRFAALANVGSGVPFLPAAFSESDTGSFALALECADLARDAFAGKRDLGEASQRLVDAIESAAAKLEAVAEHLASETGGVEFTGSDFSLAPYPRDADSIGATLESMGLGPVGRAGTAFRAAVLTSCIDRAKHRRAGYSGLFLPVLEDDRLALRAGEGELRLEDLLLAATVCGTGLDTVPLPGDISASELEPWLLDLCALALRQAKPLTARLMPMPGKSAGDRLEFEFPFFANGRVLDPRPSESTTDLRAPRSLVLVPHRGARDRA